MRITDKMNFNATNRNIRKARSSMSRLQEQAATQKRVARPSDDPVAAGRILASRVELNGNTQYKRNLEHARTFLSYGDHSLSEIADQLMRAKDLAISQAGDSGANAKTRNITATEVAEIYSQVVKLANTQFGDRYIFGGYKTMQKPFNYNGTYNGDMGEMLVHVDKDSFFGMNMPGGKIFHGQGLTGDGIAHVTVRQARSTEELHDQRAHALFSPDNRPPSPPLPGGLKSSPLENTENPDNQTLELSKNKGLRPDLLSDGQPALRSPSSLDAELSKPTPADEAYRVTQLRDLNYEHIGKLNPDPTELQDTGGPAEGRDLYGFKNYTGVNIFAVVNKLEIALKTNDKFAIQDSLDHIDEAINQVVMARSQLGSRIGTIDAAFETLQKQNIDIQKNISSNEDADMFEVVSDIGAAQSSLEATLQTSSKLMQTSLYDFIR